jgi:threonine dehydratase/serine racemase
MSISSAPSRPDIDAAAARIAPFISRTPVLHFDALDAWVGARVFVKAEHRQQTGAFKYRGATNAVQSLLPVEAARGVAAHSSGNHAAALARAAQVRGIPAYVVMPEATTARKRAAVESYGADVTWCANTLDARREGLAEVLERTGAIEIHPFTDVRVIAGAGTAALELCAEVPDLDVIVTPVGGGGLCSGTSIAAAPRRVIGAAPSAGSASIADGLRTGTSLFTDAILDAHHVERVEIEEDAIADAQREVSELLGESIEPSAAIAFAAARAAQLDGARVGIICSGGNVD